MRICNLSSGSEGNSTYVEVGNTKLLVDGGLSASKLSQSLSKINVQASEIDAILISHEHYDHISGIDAFASKFKTKIYAHKKIWGLLDKKLFRTEQFQKNIFFSESFVIKDAFIQTHEVSHDATHTSAFTIGDGKNSFSIITDLGKIEKEVLNFASKSALVYIESNHDENMLRLNPKYSFFLKQRILSGQGHLSNFACAKAIENFAQNGTRQIVLSHLSKENNTPELAYNSVCSFLKDHGIIEGKHIKIDVATTEVGHMFKLG